MPTPKTTSRAKAVKKADAIMEQQCELAPFANNPHETEYTRMMHRYSELDKREKAVSRKQTVANLVLFVGVLLVISCLVGTWFVCSTIQSLQL